MNIPWLTVLIAVPLVGALVTAFLPRTALPRHVALAVSVLTLVGAGVVAAG
jgi:NADH-quinone oxidoreductase subunit M